MKWIFLDFGSYEIKALRCAIDGQRIVVEDAAKFESRPEYFEGLNLPTQPAWNAVSVGLSELGWSMDDQAAVATNLPGSYLESRYLQFPFVSEKKIEKVLPLEVESTLPFDLEEVILKSKILKGDAIKKNPKHALVLALTYRRELVKRYEQALRNFQLSPPPISIDILSLTSLRQGVGAFPVVGFLHIGHQKTEWILIQRSGDLLGLRTFWWGASQMQDALRQALEVDEARARQLFVEEASFNVSTDSQAVHIRMTDALEDSLTEFMNEFRQSLKALEQAGIDYPRPLPIFLLGRASRVPGLATRIEERFKSEYDLSVTEYPWMQLEKQVPGLSSLDDSMAFVPCLAQALSQTRIHRSKILNFSESSFQFQQNIKKIRAQSISILKKLAILMLIPAIYMILSFVYHKKEYTSLNDQLQNLLKRNQLEFDANMPPSDILKRLREELIGFRRKADQLKEDDTSPLLILTDLSRAIPESLKVDIRDFNVTDTKVFVKALTDSDASREKIIEATQRVFNGLKSGATEACSDYDGCRSFSLEFDRPEQGVR
ncbi:MAG: hypothetical protein COV44_05980 [Deltaproteobacteria bacterium CG11_big_fil_rev_8_21_14_0_20_45_16]|nr:MAG: hypothetical protein COV44_05980 [Deltaproteobacteria bacterium CG11_big_fil_rev_8_21_14_0_20_45_16]